ncbi:MAG: hypothetical protein RIE73_25545 [Coleofasciculus sp. C1-SOL-03]
MRTIRDRLLNSKRSVRLLELYRQILGQAEVASVDSPEERELIFDQSWVVLHLNPNSKWD